VETLYFGEFRTPPDANNKNRSQLAAMDVLWTSPPEDAKKGNKALWGSKYLGGKIGYKSPLFPCQLNSNLPAPRISKSRETDNCKTKTSMEFGYFEAAFHVRNLESMTTIQGCRF